MQREESPHHSFVLVLVITDNPGLCLDGLHSDCVEGLLPLGIGDESVQVSYIIIIIDFEIFKVVICLRRCKGSSFILDRNLIRSVSREPS